MVPGMQISSGVLPPRTCITSSSWPSHCETVIKLGLPSLKLNLIGILLAEIADTKHRATTDFIFLLTTLVEVNQAIL